MALIILLLIIAAPVVELSLLIDVGGEIGAIQTVLLCLLTAAIGLSLVRLQGMAVIKNMQTASQSGKPVGESLIHGFFLLIAGICLFIPGFITDTIGALLLIPFVRLMLGRAGLAHMVVRTRTQQQGSPFSNTAPDEASDTLDEGMIIDGEFQEANTQENASKDVRGPSETEKTNPGDKEI